MISDTLYQSIEDIKKYLQDSSSLYGEESRAKIEPLLEQMWQVFLYLNAAPQNTDSNKTHKR